MLYVYPGVDEDVNTEEYKKLQGKRWNWIRNKAEKQSQIYGNTLRQLTKLLVKLWRLRRRRQAEAIGVLLVRD